MIVLLNRTNQTVKSDDFGIKQVVVEPKNLVLLEAPATNPLFISILVSFLGTEQLARLFQEEREEEKRVLALVDSILRYPNMKRFQEIVEEEFSKFFKAERANLIIVNRN